MISKNKAESQIRGVADGNLDTHLCCKCIATMVATGCTVSPPIVSIYVKVGWVTRGVKYRYIKRE